MRVLSMKFNCLTWELNARLVGSAHMLKVQKSMFGGMSGSYIVSHQSVIWNKLIIDTLFLIVNKLASFVYV